MARIYIQRVADGIGTKGNTANERMEIYVYVGSASNSVKLATVEVVYPKNSNVATYYDIYNSLLIDLWNLSKNFIKFVLSKIESHLSDVTKDIILQSKYNYKTFIGFIDRFRQKIEYIVYDNSSNEFYLNMNKFFFSEVEKKIDDLDKEYSRQRS